jgi:hypothetical protein
VTASVVAVFQSTVAESFEALDCATGESLLPPQAVRAASEAAAMAVGIHRVEIIFIRAPEVRGRRSRRASDQPSLSVTSSQLLTSMMCRIARFAAILR